MSVAGRVKSGLDIVSTIAVIVAAGALLWKVFADQPATVRRTQQVEGVKGLRIDPALIRNVTGTGRVAIVEFFDFQCPFCRRHAQDIEPAITKDLVKSGRARYLALHYPIEEIHPLALSASEAAECAGRQGRFWEMREQLFARSSPLTDSEVIRNAQALRLDEMQFKRCLEEGVTLEKIRADQEEGRRLGVNETPAFFLGIVDSDGGIDLAVRIRGLATVETFISEVAKLDSSARRAYAH